MITKRTVVLFYTLAIAVSVVSMLKQELFRENFHYVYSSVLNVHQSNENFVFVEAEIFETTTELMQEALKIPTDLALEKVTLTKIAEPTASFNYYKYKANVVIKNLGGKLSNSTVVLNAGEDQKYVFVKNDVEGFSLAKDKSYIYENYEVLFDGDYNGGKLLFTLDIKDHEDLYKNNNSYEVEIFEMPSKLQDFGITGIEDDGTFDLNFKPVNPAVNADEFEFFVSETVRFEEDEIKYAELETSEKIYGYHRIKNSLENLKSSYFRATKVEDFQASEIKFSDDPFNDKIAHYAYLKATNARNGNYAISNIIRFSPQKYLTRADFAKNFVEFAEITLSADGASFYEDVSLNQWYGPYVQTLFNLGLLKDESAFYFPDELMERGAALRVVLDYFDIELALKNKVARFEDSNEDDYLFPYLEALYSTGNGGAFGEAFNQKLPATKNYLKYLIHEYSKNT